MADKVIYFITEGVGKSAEKEYLNHIYNLLKLKDKNIRFNFLNTTGGEPKTVLNNVYKKQEYKNLQKIRKKSPENIMIFYLCDYDDRQGTTNISTECKNKNITLLLSNPCFEQFLEYHKNDKIHIKSENRKTELLDNIKNITIDDVKSACNIARQKAVSAEHNTENPSCLTYTGSDMFQLINFIYALIK